jgi:hypothetical protein
VLPLFWANTLFWDTARWVTTPDNDGNNKFSSSVSRHVTPMSRKRERKRLTHLPSLYFFAATWLIFEGTVLLLPTAYHNHQPTHPFSEVKKRMLDTYRRVESLDVMVVLSPGVFPQYQKIQAKQMWSEIRPESKLEETEARGEEFFYAIQNLPSYYENENSEFLDSRDDIEIYEENNVKDLLQLYSIYCDRTVVNCVGTQPTQSQVNLVEASDRAIEPLTDETWLLTAAVCNTFGNHQGPIIFDMGASLAITPDVDDFIDPPASLGTTMKLGGLANNLEIRGVGTVC